MRIKVLVEKDGFNLNIDIDIPDNGVTMVYGPSGAGKTTLLRSIAGLEKNIDGLIKVGDSVWQDDNICLPVHSRSLGFVFQDPSLFPHLSVKDNIEYGLKRAPGLENNNLMDRSIELLNIGSLLGRMPEQLSGGEKQRIAIARAISCSPKILLMDEPLSSLDSSHKKEIMPYLESLNDNLEIPIVYVSHSSDEVIRLSDYLIYLDRGLVIDQGSISEMLSNPELPFSQGDNAKSLIKGSVKQHDEKFNLTYIEFSGGIISVASESLSIGRSVRLSVGARDVSITRDHQSDTSILNIFPARIEKIVSDGNAQVMVRCRIGQGMLLSRITRKSAHLLNLREGDNVFAQIKSVALL